MEPLDRATIWPYDDSGEPRDFYYSRYASPTVADAEARLGELEGGEALLFPSGSGATTALVLSLLKPGDTIALAEGCYFGTGGIFQALAKWGLEYVEFDQTGRPPDGVQLVWLEAPSNPFLTMPNLSAAAAHPAPVVVDFDRRDSYSSAAARARRGLRPAQRDEVPRRSRRRVARRSRRPQPRRPAQVPHANRDLPRARPSLAFAARTEDARAARPPSNGNCGRSGRAPARAPEGPGGALSRPRRPTLIRPGRRRGRPAGGDVDPARRKRHVSRRRDERDGEPLPLGRRPRPGGPPPLQRRGRGRRRPLGPISPRRSTARSIH